MSNTINSQRVFIAYDTYNPSEVEKIVERHESETAVPRDTYVPSESRAFEPYYPTQGNTTYQGHSALESE